MIYIALLRGINVSGQKIIKMDLLASLFTELKLTNVRTYIQSGNVIFESNSNDRIKLSQRIRLHLKIKLEMDIPVILRTSEELERIVQFDPFPNRIMPGKSMLYISFLENQAPENSSALLQNMENKNEFLVLQEQEVYSLIRKDTTDKIRFTNMVLEKAMQQAATTRNINTVQKLVVLCKK